MVQEVVLAGDSDGQLTWVIGLTRDTEFSFRINDRRVELFVDGAPATTS